MKFLHEAQCGPAGTAVKQTQTPTAARSEAWRLEKHFHNSPTLLFPLDFLLDYLPCWSNLFWSVNCSISFGAVLVLQPHVYSAVVYHLPLCISQPFPLLHRWPEFKCNTDLEPNLSAVASLFSHFSAFIHGTHSSSFPHLTSPQLAATSTACYVSMTHNTKLSGTDRAGNV